MTSCSVTAEPSASAPLRPEPREDSDRKWLDAIESDLRSSTGFADVQLDIQGVHCSGCVGALEQLFDKMGSTGSLVCNPAIGVLHLKVRDSFPLREWVEAVEQLGYRLGPSSKTERPRSDALLIRAGILVALALNAMVFSAALYVGLSEGPIFDLVRWLNYAIATLAVLIGAPVFVRPALASLKHRVMHFDIPIALGVVLAFGASSIAFFARWDHAVYFDTVTVFVALMVLGRWFRERIVERNRNQLLSGASAEGLLSRIVRDGRPRVAPCTEIHAGDRLLIAPGDLVPVESTLEGSDGVISLDWINGESAPRPVKDGQQIPAGAFNQGSRAAQVIASEDFRSSRLLQLLRPVEETAPVESTTWWRKISGVYVLFIVSAAVLGFVGWVLISGDVVRALQVTTAVLVVSCPCAFGIATPLAYELAHLGLRRAGLFVRKARFLERAVEVEQVAFDKTGTLTLGVLEVSNVERIAALPEFDRDVLYNLAVRSSHPKSAGGECRP